MFSIATLQNRNVSLRYPRNEPHAPFLRYQPTKQEFSHLHVSRTDAWNTFSHHTLFLLRYSSFQVQFTVISMTFHTTKLQYHHFRHRFFSIVFHFQAISDLSKHYPPIWHSLPLSRCWHCPLPIDTIKMASRKQPIQSILHHLFRTSLVLPKGIHLPVIHCCRLPTKHFQEPTHNNPFRIPRYWNHN